MESPQWVALLVARRRERSRTTHIVTVLCFLQFSSVPKANDGTAPQIEGQPFPSASPDPHTATQRPVIRRYTIWCSERAVK